MKTYSNAELADIIEDEGAGYAITEYVDPERIEDVETRRQWLAAKIAVESVCQRVFRARSANE